MYLAHVFLFADTGTIPRPRPPLLQSNHQLTVSAGFLLLSLLSSLIIIPARGFHAGKAYGICLLCIYLSYLTASLCIEFIH